MTGGVISTENNYWENARYGPFSHILPLLVSCLYYAWPGAYSKTLKLGHSTFSDTLSQATSAGLYAKCYLGIISETRALVKLSTLQQDARKTDFGNSYVRICPVHAITIHSLPE